MRLVVVGLMLLVFVVCPVAADPTSCAAGGRNKTADENSMLQKRSEVRMSEHVVQLGTGGGGGGGGGGGPGGDCMAPEKRFALIVAQDLANAGIYSRGDEGSSECAAGSIESAAECEAAAAQLSETYEKAEDEAGWPKGCYLFEGGNVYMNTVDTGEGNAKATPICKKPLTFVKGAANAGQCTIGNIESAAECEAAAAQLSETYEKTEDEAGWPKGCYLHEGGNVYMNTVDTGEGHEKATPICKKASYVAGAAASSECAFGGIESEAECKAAAAQFFGKYVKSEDVVGWPKGCYEYQSGGLFYMNIVETGAGNAEGTPICKKDVPKDEYFPPDLSSIAAPTQMCGDSAQGISESCVKYNNWKTIQDVDQQLGRKYSVIGASGITFNDIEQGALGNCYFLAALAAIAYHNKQPLEDLFVERHLWKQNIFKTRWFINGKETVVAVDNLIPANDDNAYFTWPSATGEVWPLLASKSYAKVFGTYKTIESGSGVEAIKAITRAPGTYKSVSQMTEDEIWNLLRDATTNKYPTCCGISTGHTTQYGLPTGHEYTMLSAWTSEDYGKLVEIYNPHAQTMEHHGSVPNSVAKNSEHKGVFAMTLSEFKKAFTDISLAYVIPGHQVASLMVPAGKQVAKDVTVGPGKFWVSLVWSSARMKQDCSHLPKNSRHLNPDSFSIRAQLSTDEETRVGTALNRWADDNDYALEIVSPDGGTYNVLAQVKFAEGATFLPEDYEVALTVYAGPTAPTISDYPHDIEYLIGEIGGDE